jgi:serine/threonine protein kinase
MKKTLVFFWRILYARGNPSSDVALLYLHLKPQWALEQPIGSGSFAIVWKAHHVVDVELVAAVKEINTEKLNPKLRESLTSEISVLKRTKHVNCVRLLDLMKV